MKMYYPAVEVERTPNPGEKPDHWQVFLCEGDHHTQLATCTTEERARVIAEENPPIFCPDCGYAGGDDYELSEGFRLMEIIESFYHFELGGNVLTVDPYSLDTDPEQAPKETRIHCGSCDVAFQVPEGFRVVFE